MFILDLSDTLDMLRNVLMALIFISLFHFAFFEHWSRIRIF